MAFPSSLSSFGAYAAHVVSILGNSEATRSPKLDRIFIFSFDFFHIDLLYQADAIHPSFICG